MIKFLPVVILILLVSGTFLYIRSKAEKPASPVPETVETVSKALPTPASTSNEDRIKALEDSVVLIAKKVGSLSSGSVQSADWRTTSPQTETRIKNLENTVVSLQGQIDTLKGTSTQTPTSSKKSPVYIPLGSNGTTNDKNWYSIANYQANINPGDYPGYTNMQLEMVMNLNEAVGTAKARLYNNTDSSAVSSSEVSTSATTATLLTSSGFTLPAGSKTYILQIQSTEGYTVNLQSARIRVNF